MEDNEARAYIVIVAVSIVLFIIVFTFMLSEYSKYYQCANSTQVWCSDNWRCQNNDTTVNPCFITATNDTGLASCLFGVDSTQASFCTDDSCPCVEEYNSTNNCFSGCAKSLYEVTGSSACCCTEGSECSCPT